MLQSCGVAMQVVIFARDICHTFLIDSGAPKSIVRSWFKVKQCLGQCWNICSTRTPRKKVVNVPCLLCCSVLLAGN